MVTQKGKYWEVRAFWRDGTGKNAAGAGPSSEQSSLLSNGLRTPSLPMLE